MDIDQKEGLQRITSVDHGSFFDFYRNRSVSYTHLDVYKRQVTIYSDADKIELLVNGKSAGKKKPKKDIAKFRKIPYEAGKIEAIAYDSSGKETARTTLVSCLLYTS